MNPHHYKRWMQEIGFVDVEQKLFSWPIGPWAKGDYYKTLGSMFVEDLMNGLDGISLKVMTLLGWNPEDIKLFVEELRKDVVNSKMHAYLPM
jgi:hypothetical protein